MSVLYGHVVAFRALAEALSTEANEIGDDLNAVLLARISAAYGRAAEKLAAQIQADIEKPRGW